MSFLRRLVGKEEGDEIPGQAHILRDGICVGLSSHMVSADNIAQRIKAGLRPASLNQRVRERVAFIARLIAFLTATEPEAYQATAKAISEALADASEAKPLMRARYQLTTAVRAAVSNRRNVIGVKKDWGELMGLISRFEALGQEDDGLRRELNVTCECLETIAFRHLDDAMKRSGEALEDLRLKSRLTGPITYSGAINDPNYLKSLQCDPRIAESKKLAETALSYVNKSLEARGTRKLSGGRDFELYSEYLDYLQSL